MSRTIISSAPGRCGIIGNPTDIYGGRVISIATQERAHCRISLSDRLQICSGELKDSPLSQESLRQRGDHLDIARAVLRRRGVDPRRADFELTTSTTIPMKAGMAGSTALVVAVLGAVLAWQGEIWHPWSIAEEARRIEADEMGVFCGLQDQHMAVFGGINAMDFAGKQALQLSEEEPLASVEPLIGFVSQIPLLAAHTGVAHDSGKVHRSPRERWVAGDPEVISAYAQIAQLAALGKRALLDRDWVRLGELMNENHQLVSGLGGSGPENERLITAARKAGAFGAKLAGAGGGGTVLVLTDEPERLGPILAAAGADGFYVPTGGRGLEVVVE